MDRPLPPIIHEDERLIVLDKPSGLLSVPGIGPEKADCLAARVAAAFPEQEPRIVHRLDRDTSGVIVMAFDAEAHRELSRQFQDRQVSKRYIAIVAGRIAEDEGVIDLPIRKDLDDPPRQIIDHVHGRRAITEYRVVERFDDRTRLKLKLITGRSHQIRLHLKVLGHPVLGDDLYAPPEIRAMADRLLLHAASLTIIHPSTAELRTYEAVCPF
jgi:tRNA pseudouridine32 synthase/23S rRNA pseudouridine746 synthase